MNKARRKKIQDISEKLEIIREHITEIKCEIEEIRDDEQEYLQFMPENFQNSIKGQSAESAIEALDDTINEISNFDESFDNVISYLYKAEE